MFLGSGLSVWLLLSVKWTMVRPQAIGDAFRQCLISQPMTFGKCMAVGALGRLQALDSNPEFDLIDGVTMVKDNTQEYREEYDFADTGTSSFRSIIDGFNYVFSKRNTHWKMDFLYPGLGMQLVPSGTPGGLLEFILDPHQEVVNAHSLKEAGTGTIIARQFVLPFLLGLKFKVATILPIMFGILALIAKKAVIISKIALIVSTAFGLGTLLFSYGAFKPHGGYYHQQQFNPGFGGHYNKYQEEDYNNVVYRGMVNDQFRHMEEVYDNLDKTGKGRNFAWSEDEKQKSVPVA